MVELLELCRDLPVEQVAAGGVLIEEDAFPGRMLVLESGAVTIERAGTVFARIDFPGAVFGELSWVLGKPATATVRAETDVVLRVIDDPRQFLTTRPEAAIAVLRTTATRLDGLTQYLVDVKQQFSGLSDHLGMVDGILDTLVHHQPARARTGSRRDPDSY